MVSRRGLGSARVHHVDMESRDGNDNDELATTLLAQGLHIIDSPLWIAGVSAVRARAP